jgi:hypothetical protein
MCLDSDPDDPRSGNTNDAALLFPVHPFGKMAYPARLFPSNHAWVTLQILPADHMPRRVNRDIHTPT